MRSGLMEGVDIREWVGDDGSDRRREEWWWKYLCRLRGPRVYGADVFLRISGLGRGVICRAEV
jgi:hypothetical protein